VAEIGWFQLGFKEKTAVSVGFDFLTTIKISCGYLMITHTPTAKCKLHGWSSDGALLMRRGGGRETADKTDPRCPLIISSREWRHCCRYLLSWRFHACQFAVIGRFDWRDRAGRQRGLRQTCIITPQLSVGRLDRSRQTDKDR